MPTKTEQQAEQAVRDYLNWLNQGVESSEEYKKLEAELEATDDPIAKVELVQQMINLRDGKGLADAFKKHVKAWAEKKGIEEQAFVEIGVSPVLLSEAGFTGVRGPDLARSTPEKPKAKSRTRVSREDVERSIRGHRKDTDLTINSVAGLTGASKQTVKTVLDSLVGDAVAEPVDDPNHSGRGRAPKVYKKL